jgi:hypothetical protein
LTPEGAQARTSAGAWLSKWGERPAGIASLSGILYIFLGIAALAVGPTGELGFLWATALLVTFYLVEGLVIAVGLMMAPFYEPRDVIGWRPPKEDFGLLRLEIRNKVLASTLSGAGGMALLALVGPSLWLALRATPVNTVGLIAAVGFAALVIVPCAIFAYYGHRALKAMAVLKTRGLLRGRPD